MEPSTCGKMGQLYVLALVTTSLVGALAMTVEERNFNRIQKESIQKAAKINLPPVLQRSRACPCSDSSLCNGITGKATHEIFPFSVSPDNWPEYDWGRVTTVVEFNYINDSLLCFAHSRGVRVVFNTNVDVDALTNETARAEWVQQQVQKMIDNYLDGINVDFEAEIDADQDAERQGLTTLMQELSQSMKSRFPDSQLTFDFAWSPNCVDKRCYDYKAIADAMDYVFVMAYDERSQIFEPGPCKAGANSHLNWTQTGLEQYLQLGVSAEKLILGVPWYGYNYHCIDYQSSSGLCEIEEVPFRGANCSDAAGRQHNFAQLISDFLPQSFTGLLWDSDSQTPYFAYQDSSDSHIHQVWFDDPQSLIIKSDLAVSLGIGGMGMWQADAIDYSNATQVQQMWGTFPW